MAQTWLYYVTYVAQGSEGKIGLSAKLMKFPKRIDSPEMIWGMIDQIIAEIFPKGPPKLPDDVLPVVPLTWELLSAKQGAAVPPPEGE